MKKGKEFNLRSCFSLKNENRIIGLLLVVLGFIPLITKNNVLINTLILSLMYILLAQSLNVVNGYSGQFNVGQAGFFCVGAYTAAILVTRHQVSFWLLLPLCGLTAALVSLLLSLPTGRLRGMYFTIVTLGFSEIVRQLFLNWTSLTRGPRGISGIPKPTFFGIDFSRGIFFYYVLLFLVALMIFATHRILNSRVGRSWLAMREDEQAAASLGINILKCRVVNLAYSAFWAGVAGCVFAFFQRFVSPESFSLDESFNILAMNVIGGQGTLLGPIAGVVAITSLTEMFRSALQYRMLLYSILIIVMMWIRPQGIVGALNKPGARRADKDKKPNNQVCEEDAHDHT